MAISIQKTKKAVENDDSIVDFLCDAESDVLSLPTQKRGTDGLAVATGSTATVLAPSDGKSNRRILNASGKWVDMPLDLIIDCGSPADRA